MPTAAPGCAAFACSLARRTWYGVHLTPSEPPSVVGSAVHSAMISLSVSVGCTASKLSICVANW